MLSIQQTIVKYFVELSVILSYIMQMTNKRMYIDVKAVVLFFGGGTVLSGLFDKYHFEPAPRAYLYKWVERKSMPLDRWLEIEYIATREGVLKALRKAVIMTEPAQQAQPVQEQEQSPSIEVEPRQSRYSY